MAPGFVIHFSCFHVFSFSEGCELKDGRRLLYPLNAFSAMLCSFALFALLHVGGLVDANYLSKNFLELQTAAIVAFSLVRCHQFFSVRRYFLWRYLSTCTPPQSFMSLWVLWQKVTALHCFVELRFKCSFLKTKKWRKVSWHLKVASRATPSMTFSLVVR